MGLFALTIPSSSKWFACMMRGAFFWPAFLLFGLFTYCLVKKAICLIEFLFPPGRVDPSSTRYGGELVAETLKSHGIQYVFTTGGTHISPILVACEKIGIKVIDCRLSDTAVFAAEAMGRLSGLPGVVVLSAGPALTAAATAIQNSKLAEAPIIILAGSVPTMMKKRGALFGIDQPRIFKSLCKCFCCVSAVREIPCHIKQAFVKAQEGVPGPVCVEFPMDSLVPYSEVAKGYGKIPTGKDVSEAHVLQSKTNIMSKFAVWCYEKQLRYLFSGAWSTRYDYSPLKIDIPLAREDQLDRAVEFISRAKKPLFLIGSQATLPPMRAEDVRDALESIGIPCFLSGMARGLLGRDSKLHIREERKDALQEADVVVLIGVVPDFRLDFGRMFSEDSTIITVNRGRKQLRFNSDVFWTATLGINADPGCFLLSLSRRLQHFNLDSTWLQTLHTRMTEKQRLIDEAAQVHTDHINPVRLLKWIDRLLPQDCLMIVDGGDFVGTAAHVVHPRGPLRWLDAGSFGASGCGSGFAIGAKLARPDIPVFVIYGDASLARSLVEFDTFSRHNLNVFGIVGNNGYSNCIHKFGSEQTKADYHATVAGLGAYGFLLKGERDIQNVLDQALQVFRQGHSVLINAWIGRTNFRAGSIAC